jgi:nucleotide-binding universal stress UspA family protein
MPGPVLLAYDGSDDAKRAIEVAGQLSGGSAVVLHVWPPAPAPSAAVIPPGMVGGPAEMVPLPPEELASREAEAERAGLGIVREGLQLANRTGFEATHELRPGAGARDVWHAILEVADECDARVIVVGHRGASGIRAMLLGGVAEGVVRHARRPVLVVPLTPGAER